MRIKTIDISIPDEPGSDPFLNCKLGRKPYAEALTDIITGYSTGFVLSLDSEWGTGKTTFLRMWNQHLKNIGFKTIAFNAWESDFERDVLLTLIAEIGEIKDSKTEKALKTVIEKAAPLTRKIIPTLTRQIAKKVVGKELVEEVIGAFSEVGSEELEKAIKSYANRKSGMEEFKVALAQFVANVSNGKPVVFIIDELDRCRPSYAVEILEIVKHLFSVEGIVFVLSIDKRHLEHSIKGVYGSDNIDATDYLRRFIDIEYNLPRPTTSDYVNYLYDHFQFDVFLRHPSRLKSSDLKEDKDEFLTYAKLLFELSSVSLRLMEKMLGQTRIALSTFSLTAYVFPSSVLLLIYFRLTNLKLYKQIQDKTIDPQSLVNEIDNLPINFNNDRQRSVFIRSIGLIVHLHNNNINYEGTDIKLIVYNSQSEYTSKIHSKHDAPNDKHLLSILPTLIERHPFYDLKLDYILKKISLFERVSTL